MHAAHMRHSFVFTVEQRGMDVLGLDRISDLLQRFEVHLREQIMPAVVESAQSGDTRQFVCLFGRHERGLPVRMPRISRCAVASPALAYTGRIGSVLSLGRSPSNAVMQNASMP
jgi:hypothetical protein